MHDCANIGPRGQRFRLAYGLFDVAVAIVMAVVFVHAPLWQRALIAIPLFGAALGIFQYREKT
jgi:hypothetical protein